MRAKTKIIHSGITKKEWQELVDGYEEKLRIKDKQIEELEGDLRLQLSEEQTKRQTDINTIYGSVGEIVRLRRELEIISEERDALQRKVADLERRLNNLKLWFQIEGVKVKDE